MMRRAAWARLASQGRQTEREGIIAAHYVLVRCARCGPRRLLGVGCAAKTAFLGPRSLEAEGEDCVYRVRARREMRSGRGGVRKGWVGLWA